MARVRKHGLTGGELLASRDLTALPVLYFAWLFSTSAFCRGRIIKFSKFGAILSRLRSSLEERSSSSLPLQCVWHLGPTSSVGVAWRGVVEPA